MAIHAVTDDLIRVVKVYRKELKKLSATHSKDYDEAIIKNLVNATALKPVRIIDGEFEYTPNVLLSAYRYLCAPSCTINEIEFLEKLNETLKKRDIELTPSMQTAVCIWYKLLGDFEDYKKLFKLRIAIQEVTGEDDIDLKAAEDLHCIAIDVIEAIDVRVTVIEYENETFLYEV